MKKITLGFILLLSLIATSCARQQFKIAEGIYKEEPDFEGTSHFFISGLGQSDVLSEAKIAEVCKARGGVAKYQSRQKFWQAIVSGVTWGVYTPRNMEIYCVR